MDPIGPIRIQTKPVSYWPVCWPIGHGKGQEAGGFLLPQLWPSTFDLLSHSSHVGALPSENNLSRLSLLHTHADILSVCFEFKRLSLFSWPTVSLLSRLLRCAYVCELFTHCVCAFNWPLVAPYGTVYPGLIRHSFFICYVWLCLQTHNIKPHDILVMLGTDPMTYWLSLVHIQ